MEIHSIYANLKSYTPTPSRIRQTKSNGISKYGKELEYEKQTEKKKKIAQEKEKRKKQIF